MTNTKKRIAFFFGGRSPEHDVSTVTGLQGLQAIDTTRYDAFPVYITPDGRWLVGDDLRDRNNYVIAADANVTEVTMDVSAGRTGRLVAKSGGLFSKPRVFEFDCAFLCFHGLYGEDGNIQGLFELAGVPYTATRTAASAVYMDKVLTKRILRELEIPTLPFAVLKRPRQGMLIAEDEIKRLMGDVTFPCIVKPVHLGSSIGVAKAHNVEEIAACLPAIFEHDDAAMLEPFVENMVEYNVAVSKALSDDGRIRTSALEKPKATDELLDFKQKYLAGGNGSKGGSKTGGTKNPGQISQGMLSLTRELNPALDKSMQDNIRQWATKAFDAIGASGAPRIDFIGNSKTGEVWFNEVNPIPGSFGYFLWEALEDEPVLFTDLVTGLIEEAFDFARRKPILKDPVPADARLLRR